MDEKTKDTIGFLRFPRFFKLLSENYIIHMTAIWLNTNFSRFAQIVLTSAIMSELISAISVDLKQ